MMKSPFKYLKTRIFIVLILSVGILLAGISAMVYFRYSTDQAAGMRIWMARLAQTAALLVDAKGHRAILDQKSETTPEYQREVSKLRAFLEANTDIKYIYTMAFKDGRIVFVLDPSPIIDADGDGVIDHSAIGSEYTEGPRAKIMEAFAGREVFSSYTDRWGNFLSVFVPIRDGGTVTGVLGLDITLQEIARIERDIIARLALILGVAVVLLAILSYFITAQFLKPILRLGETVRSLAASDASTLDTHALHMELLPFAEKINDYLNKVRKELNARKEAEKALAQSERRYRELADLLPQIVFETNTVGDLTFLNAGGYRLLRYAPGDMARGISAIDMIHPEDRDKIGRYIASLLRSNRSTETNEYLVIRSDGAVFPALLYATPIIVEGEITGIRGIMVDITDRKKYEDDLRQAQKMEVVGTLAGGIAHDFNNVLGGIIGSINLLEFHLKKEKLENAAKVTQFLETALSSSNRAADMVKQLLTLSQRHEIAKLPMDMRDALKQVMNICKSSFPKLIELDFRIGDVPLSVNADSTQIHQVLLNLCVNASHAMTVMRGEGERQGGRLTVEAKQYLPDEEFYARHPEAEPGCAFVAIRVADTGVGMGRDTMDRIFEPFYTTKQKDSGTGLGLTMTYRIIMQHSGFIEVNSEKAAGSVFTVYLPYLDTIRAAQEKNALPIAKGTGKILVVDDEDILLEITGDMLEQCGYEAVTAGNASEGLKIFEKDHDNIKAVILDYSMPGVSGLEVYTALKAIDPGVKVLMSSGLFDEPTQRKAKEMWVLGFLQKPYTMEELSIIIQDVL